MRDSSSVRVDLVGRARSRRGRLGGLSRVVFDHGQRPWPPARQAWLYARPAGPGQRPLRTPWQNACGRWRAYRDRDGHWRRYSETPTSRTWPARSCGWKSSPWHTRRLTATAGGPGDRADCHARHKPAPTHGGPAPQPPRRHSAPSVLRAATPIPKGAAESRSRG